MKLRLKLSISVLALWACGCHQAEDVADHPDAAGADADTDADTDTDADSDTDTDTDTDTDSDTDMDTDSDTDTSNTLYKWHTFQGGSDSFDYGDSLALNDLGEIFVCGLSSHPWNGPDGQSPLNPHSGDSDLFVVKLSASGAYLWHTFYGSSAGGDDGVALSSDRDGSIYVTGFSGSSWSGPDGQDPLHPYSGDNDIFVLKLDAAGAYLWHTFYGSADWDLGRAITTDGNGGVFVTGDSQSAWTGSGMESPVNAHSGADDIFVLKLDQHGGYQWHTFHGGGADSDSGQSIALDSNGNLLVSGESWSSWNGPDDQWPTNPYTGSGDMVVVDLGADGAYHWHAFFGSDALEWSSSLAVDEHGDVFVTGSSGATWQGPMEHPPLNPHSGSEDIAVLKLDTDGVYQWHTFYGSGTGHDWTLAIAIDGEGNLFVSGLSSQSWNGPNGESPLNAHPQNMDNTNLLKLDPNGTYLWHTFYNGENLDSGLGHPIAVDNMGSIFVTGHNITSWNGPGGQMPLNPFPGNVSFFVLRLAE